MTFIKGHIANPKGRGHSPNRINALTRENINNYVSNDIEDLFEEISKLKGGAKVKTFTRLLEFTTPEHGRLIYR